jgi:hypothetical protein
VDPKDLKARHAVKRWTAIFLALAVGLPAGAGAAPKSILRFEKDKKRIEKKAPAPEEEAAPWEEAEDAGDSADAEGAPEPGALIPDPAGAREAPPGAEALPGTPAVLDRGIPGAPIDSRFGAPEGASSDERAAAPAGIPPRPPTPKPFVYKPAPKGAGTVTGYDASVAPPRAVRIPPLAPIVPGQPPPRPQVLPRLAPYGSALPPDQTVPPAALPR